MSRREFSGVSMYDNKFVNISNNERQASNTFVGVWLRPSRALELEAVAGTALGPTAAIGGRDINVWPRDGPLP